MPQTSTAKMLALENVAVLVLAGAPGDFEFVELKDPAADDSGLDSQIGSGRGLRCIGVIGVRGMSPHCSFNEPLSPTQTEALSRAFLAYVGALYLERHAAPARRLLAGLGQLYAPEDPRPN